MNVQVVYCSHQTAGLDLRERLGFSTQAQLEQAYDCLRREFPESEVVVVSTCNRVELYAAQEQPDEAPTQQEFARFLSDFHQVPLDDFADELLARNGAEAVRHLFQVASSVDSMVLGEPQIAGQIKEAYETAQQNEACGPLTHALFQQAIRVASRVRNETRLAAGRVSIASVAVGDFGKSIFDHFSDKRVLVIGAGEMAEETVRYLQDEGVGEIVVVNRNPERAEPLAARCGGTVKPFEELDRWMAEADVIVSTTGAEEPIVAAARFAQVREAARYKPVFILDLGAPRDFDPDVNDLDDDVFLYDIDDLEATCEKNRRLRAGELEKAEQIIEEETEKFMHEVYHRATGPIITRLRDEWHEISRQELERLFNKLSHLDAKDREQIERSMQRVVNKLLHPPLETLKDQAREGPPHGLMEALKRLFHLH